MQIFHDGMLAASQSVAVIGAKTLLIPMAEIISLGHLFRMELPGKGGV
ncbi:MAG TPA: hypothetical protein PLK31_02340 [Chloroflexota bacterium]|nr:hypothetical protein [Chloroflexota bacterium]